MLFERSHSQKVFDGALLTMTTHLPENYSDSIPENREDMAYRATIRESLVDSTDRFEDLLTRAVGWTLGESRPVVRISDVKYYLSGDNPDALNRVVAEALRIAIQKTAGWPKVFFKTYCQSAGKRPDNFSKQGEPSRWKVMLWAE